MSDQVRDRLTGMVAEALELRFSLKYPEPGASPAQLSETLLDSRRRCDRIEELYGKAIRLRGQARRTAAARTAEVDELWDHAVTANRRAPVRPGDEYATAKERHAEANLATLDQRRQARIAADVADFCDECADVLRLTHRGMDTVRQDLAALLRASAFESHLER